MIRSTKETNDFSIPLTKNCGTLFDQTHTKPEGTPKTQLTQSTRTFSFKPPIPIE